MRRLAGAQRGAGRLEGAAAGQADGVEQRVGRHRVGVDAEHAGQDLGAAQRLEEARRVDPRQVLDGDARRGVDALLGEGAGAGEVPGGEVGAARLEAGARLDAESGSR